MPWLPDWMAHPEEWEVFLLVALIAGVGLLFLFRLTLGGALRSPGRAYLPAKSFRRVLLPAAPDWDYTPGAVSLACRLAGNGAQILLTYVIEVPRTLSPDAPMPEEEAQARRALTRASEIVKKYGIKASAQIRRGRLATEETLRAASEGKADLLVLPAPAGEEIARRAPCEVVLARAAPE